MKRMAPYTVYVALIIILVSVASLVAFVSLSRNNNAAPLPKYPICCIMVTGKDDERIEYARKSVANFLEQSYPNKMLVIINHNPNARVIDNAPPSLFEFHVPKTGTLGQLRNIALQMVPVNAYWTTWDDDDYRAPNYLETLAAHIPPQSSNLLPPIVISISNRLEYNKNNGFSWYARKSNGFVLFLAPFDNRIIYLEKDTMEDTSILNDYKNLKYAIKVIDNDPKLYVRLVHTTNTSLHVDPKRNYLKEGPSYSERITNEKERQYIHAILPKLLLSGTV